MLVILLFTLSFIFSLSQFALAKKATFTSFVWFILMSILPPFAFFFFLLSMNHKFRLVDTLFLAYLFSMDKSTVSFFSMISQLFLVAIVAFTGMWYLFPFLFIYLVIFYTGVSIFAFIVFATFIPEQLGRYTTGFQ